MATEKYQNKYRIASARMKNYDYGSDGAYFVTIVTKNREHFFGKIVGDNRVDGDTGNAVDGDVGNAVDGDVGNAVDGRDVACNVSTAAATTTTATAMQLSEIGEIVQKFWNEIPKHFPFIKLDEMVIMPNHIHGILLIDKSMGTVEGNDAVGGGDDDAVGGGDDDAVGGNDDDAVGGNDDDAVGGRDVACNVSTGKTGKTNETKNKQMAKISPKNGSLASVIRSFKSVVTKNSRELKKSKNIFAWQPRFHDRIIRNENELNRIRNYIIKNPEMWYRDKNNGNL